MAYAMPQIEGVEHHFLRVGETGFHVAEAGSGDPVLLLHGWPQHWYAWRLVIPKLAERHRVLAMDLRGFGWSDIAWTDFEKPKLADDVIGLLAKLEIDRVRLAGHDWGAWIAYLVALERPDLVERVALLSSGLPSVAPIPSLRSAMAIRHQFLLAAPHYGPKAVRDGGYVKRALRAWSTDHDNLTQHVTKLYARDHKASTRARASTLLHRSFLTKELLPALAGRYRRQRLEVPALVMVGDEDPLVPRRMLQGAEKHAADLRVELVPGAGHFLPEERPELVAERLTEFFAAGSEPPAPADAATAAA